MLTFIKFIKLIITIIMKPLKEMTKKDIKNIKLIVFDVDGILVPRGTEINQHGQYLSIKVKKIPESEIKLIKQLHAKGFKINISSGRALYMLEKMFAEVLPYVSLTYENGSVSWINGKVYQHVNSFSKLKEVAEKLGQVKSASIKGFEPKEFTITIHCKKRVKAIERVISKYIELYFIWNSEAYDIGLKKKQTKAVGLGNLMRILRLKKKNVLAIGDNYNDKELINAAGISVSADKKRVKGNFFVALSRKCLPAEKLMQRILELRAI